VAAFEYLALDAAGKQKKGVMEGDSQRQVRQNLREKGLTPLSVDTVSQDHSQKGDAKFGLLGFRLGGGPSINVRDLALITRQMATLIQAGLPIEEVLGAVSQQTEKPKIRSILMAVRSKVLEGFSLADGFGEFPRAFPKLYRATVSAGLDQATTLQHGQMGRQCVVRHREQSRDVAGGKAFRFVLHQQLEHGHPGGLRECRERENGLL